jgi:hypothetical protein
MIGVTDYNSDYHFGDVSVAVMPDNDTWNASSKAVQYDLSDYHGERSLIDDTMHVKIDDRRTRGSPHCPR